MAQLSRQQVYDLARSVGLGQFDAATAGAICDAESGRRTDAVGNNLGVGGVVISRDRGLWQINNFWHPDVSDACAFDATCNAQAMQRISRNGTSWTPWSTFNSGAFRGFLPAYLQIAGYAVPVPPPVYQPIQALLTDIRRGMPIWRAVVHNLEQTVTAIRRAQYGENVSGTDLGGGFW